MLVRRLMLIVLIAMFGINVPVTTSADEITLTINGVINCAHPDNAITTTCRGENPPEPTPVPPTTLEPAPPGTTITYSGDRRLNCASEPDASDPLCLPLTIDGVINCAHPDNAITTTCRGENPPEPTPTAPVTTEAPPVGSTITYSGDIAIDCSLEVNKSNNNCLPMTKADGSINCQQADNALTTTCWNSFEESRAKGEEPEVDCSQERFSTYPVCTGKKPQAVIDMEKLSSGETLTSYSTQPVIPVESSTSSTTKEETSPSSSSSVNVNEANLDAAQAAQPSGDISLQTRRANSTTLAISLVGKAENIQIVATKKGAPSITREIAGDVGDEFRLRFPRNLKGYTLTLIIDGKKVDRIKI